jgi:hypothetical protein
MKISLLLLIYLVLEYKAWMFSHSIQAQAYAVRYFQHGCTLSGFDQREKSSEIS